MKKTLLLFFVILIEGYVVLACELLAIRQLIPFVGSGTDVISIIISAVLLPLAIGYHFGGQAFRNNWQSARRRGKKPLSIRALLLRNILSALVILTLGLSYPLMQVYFGVMSAMGMHRLTQTILYVLFFLVWPVFLLGQTVPLVSNYFSRRKLSEITGKMLFFSTTGSFLGSVFSTLVLMTYIGVHFTVIATLGLLCLLAILLTRRGSWYEPILCACLFFALTMVNGNDIMQKMHIVSNNAYNTVSIYDIKGEEGSRIFNANRSPSSKVSQDPEKMFSYWQFLQKTFIAPIANANPPRDILILGAGGFTVGLDDITNNYTYVDIDPDLKRVAERYFLQKPLTPNKTVIAASARAYVHSDKKLYDFILIDVFTNIYSIPMEATTREFLLDVKKRLKPGGALVANVIGSATFRDRFSVRYNNTFASVFPSYARQTVDIYTPWDDSANSDIVNLLYIYFSRPLVEDKSTYTDDKNTYSLDRN